MMVAKAERIDPVEAHRRLESDTGAMLVCAYDEPEKFYKYHLQGAISLAEFESELDSAPLDKEIIFYCA